MISDRPYRKGMPPIEGRDAIIKSEGSDFDPTVVKAFEAAFRKQRLEIPEVMV
jgi:HD-GYP domain-containing protein (c-di-GMP phosphodiesterase class II)